MTPVNEMQQIVRSRIEALHTLVPGSVGEQMDFQLVSCDAQAGEYTLSCRTQSWMRNVAGTLHGGMCAAIVDQAMGFIAYCVKPGEGTAPTAELQVSYHRPLLPGGEVLVKVKVLTVGKSLMHLTAQAFMANQPEKLCISSTGIYVYKPSC